MKEEACACVEITIGGFHYGCDEKISKFVNISVLKLMDLIIHWNYKFQKSSALSERETFETVCKFVGNETRCIHFSVSEFKRNKKRVFLFTETWKRARNNLQARVGEH